VPEPSAQAIPGLPLFTLNSELFSYMILPLRQRHRAMVFALGAFLPAAFIFGVASRHSVPLLPALPRDLPHQPVQATNAAWLREDLWEKSQLRTRLLTDSTQSTLALELTAPEPVVKPDVLLYWIPGNPEVEESLPNDAILLGAWMQDPVRPLNVPAAAKGSQGKLVLYSLADQEIVNVTKSFSIQ
jgi:hypothetical protein